MTQERPPAAARRAERGFRWQVTNLPGHYVSLDPRGVTEITDDALAVFTNGHCHSLAIALNQLTGAPLLLCHGHDGPGWHAGVQHGRWWVDIRGRFPLQASVATGLLIRRVTPRAFYALAAEGRAFEARPADAWPWAALVAAREQMSPGDWGGDDVETRATGEQQSARMVQGG